MLFGSKAQLHSAVEIIDTILNDGTLRNKKGSVIIKRKEKRKFVQTGIIFFDSENVYASSVSDMPVPIARRIYTGGKVDPTELGRVVKSSGGDTSPEIVHQMLIHNYLTESVLDTYVKEHFLENIAEILSWENCVGEWNLNDTTKAFTMPLVSFPKLKSVIASREIKKTEFAKELSRFFKPEEFDLLTPIALTTDTDPFPSEVRAIIDLSNGENTFTDIAEQTGIGRSVVLQTVHQLWERGVLSLKYQSIDVTYNAVQKAQQHVAEEPIVNAPMKSIDLNDTSKPQEEKNDLPIEVIEESLLETQNNSNGLNEDLEDYQVSATLEFKLPEEYQNMLNETEPTADPNELEEEVVQGNQDDLESLMNSIYTKYGIVPQSYNDDEVSLDEENDEHAEDTALDNHEEVTSENIEGDTMSEKSNEEFDNNNDEFSDIFQELREIELEEMSQDNSLDSEKQHKSSHSLDDLVSELNQVAEDTEKQVHETSFEEVEEANETDVDSTKKDTNEESSKTIETTELGSDLSEEISKTMRENPDQVMVGDVTEVEINQLVLSDDSNDVVLKNNDNESRTSDESNVSNNVEESTADSASRDESDNKPKISLPEHIKNIDLEIVEVQNLQELTDRLNALSASEQLVDEEIAKSSQGSVEDEVINEKHRDYIEQDTKLQNSIQKAENLLEEYNLMIQEIDALTVKLDEMRNDYEELQSNFNSNIDLLELLEAKKKEIKKVAQETISYFSSNN